jgi:hypothetical protein
LKQVRQPTPFEQVAQPLIQLAHESRNP